jgi:Putative 2OG-Fe(II) oxygenase
MTLSVAYFQPIIMAIDNVPPVEFSKIYSLVEMLHSHPELNDSGEPMLSIRGGQQIHVYPNELGIDIMWLKTWLESICQGYMNLVTQQSGHQDLSLCKPVVGSIWTIRQESGDYQEIHQHPNAHISGNIYISAPDLDEATKKPSDGQVIFQLPQPRDIRKFMMQDTWKYNPTPGTVILFPSYIPHTVYPWKGVGSRTVMAFDAKLYPKAETLEP